MSTNTERTTAGLVGDFLAAHSAGTRFAPEALADSMQRHRSGVNRAIADLAKVRAIVKEADQNDLRRSVVYMTPEQARAWRADGGAAVQAAGVQLDPLPHTDRATKATRAAKQERAQPELRFGLWSDGALMIEGLARKQLTVPADETGALAQLFASMPEGALEALCKSALKPAFTLTVEGREYPMTSEQTAQLVTYVEQLPARAIRGTQRPGPHTVWASMGAANQGGAS